MIRNHHDTTQRKSLFKRKNIDEVQEDVDQMLTKVNNVDEESTTRYKFRQFFFTSDAVSNENDDATHSLNIETVRQLKWWVSNHLNDFLDEFNELRIDRDKYLIALANFHQFVKMYKDQKQNLFDIDNTFEKIRDKLKKIEKEKKRIKTQLINKRIEYDDLTKRYETLSSRRASHHSDEDDRDDTNEDQDNIDDNEKKLVIDDSIVSSVKFSKKKRTDKHSNSNKFTNDVNSEWLTWKVSVHDKLTINSDWYETARFMITAIIDWIDEKTARHIQSRRYNNLNYFESEIMMIFFLENIYEDSNHQRNVRREYRKLTMFDIQNFQSFYSNFHRLSIQINFDQLTLMKNLIDKLTMSLKQVLNNLFRNWLTLLQWKNDIQQMYNDLINIRKKKIRIRIQKSILTYFKSTSVASIAMSFVKSISSTLFVKLKIEHKHDLIIDQLIITSKCFICEKSNHIWKESLNVNKYSKRQWHKMQIIQMNLDIDSSDSDSKNWQLTSKTRLMNA